MHESRQKPKGRFIVLGGLNMDIVIVSKDLPGPGEYIYGEQLGFVPGGNGLNQAVAAARLGSNAQIVGFVGKDNFGKDFADFLNKEKVDTKNLKILEGSQSGTVVYYLANKVERHTVFPGSNMNASASDMPEVEISASDIVAASLTVKPEVISALFKKAKDAGAKTILNPFPNYDVSKEILNLSDYVILNEVELAYRSGEKDFAMAQHKDLQMDPETVLEKVRRIKTRDDQTIIVTLADRGVIGIKGDNLTIVKGIKVKFADATGAGDCFLGSFATGLGEGMDFKSALQLANCAAAISVQTIGTTTSFPHRKEVDSLIASQYSK